MLGDAQDAITEHWIMPQPMQVLGLVAAGSLIFGGLMLVISAIRSAELSVLAPLRYIGVIMAVVLQVVLWSVAPDAVTLAGIALAVGAGLYIIHRERVRARGQG
jgi:drug/metabolite transporter (DMT)-like permease